LKDCLYKKSFSQILLLTLAHCAEVSASEIPIKITDMYSSGGLATASHQTAHTVTPRHKILNSGGIVSKAEKSHELLRSQPSTQVDIRSIKYTDQITSVLDATGLEHFKQCASYLNEDDMGIKNIKLKADLLQGLEIQQELDFNPKRPSKHACKELFTLILN
jgi:hypothetical protein